MSEQEALFFRLEVQLDGIVGVKDECIAELQSALADAQERVQALAGECREVGKRAEAAECLTVSVIRCTKGDLQILLVVTRFVQGEASTESMVTRPAT